MPTVEGDELSREVVRLQARSERLELTIRQSGAEPCVKLSVLALYQAVELGQGGL